MVCQIGNFGTGSMKYKPKLDTEGNILTKLKKNPTSGLGGDAITRNVHRRTV